MRAVETAGGVLRMTQGNLLRCGAFGIVNTADDDVSSMCFSQPDVAFDWYPDSDTLGNLSALEERWSEPVRRAARILDRSEKFAEHCTG